MNNPVEPNFLLTREYRRFAEFCDACRRYRYIGLCHGPPGVGKTLSARYYANWDKIELLVPHSPAFEEGMTGILNTNTVFHTPRVVNSPRQLETEIGGLRFHLRNVALELLRRKEKILLEFVRERCKKDTGKRITDADRIMPETLRIPDPTRLILVDEADRLKVAALEQTRAIFDCGDIGLVLIGMPGLEKRLSRYPQLYSRVGFVHEFRPLSAGEVRELLRQLWTQSGVELPEQGVEDEEVIAAIIRITGGNFRLIHRLLAQMARIAEVNAVSAITRPIVEAARESLVIGVS